jgi:prepilin-type N-terminal cleavage/methylation domain-containing protein
VNGDVGNCAKPWIDANAERHVSAYRPTRHADIANRASTLPNRSGMCRASPFSCPYSSDAKGFSLVEVLIAIGILTTAAAAIPQLFAAATRANVEAGTITWATTVAAQKLEELEAQSSLDATGEFIDYLDARGAITATGSPRAFRRRWWIEPLSWTPGGPFVVGVAVSRYREDDDGTGETVRLVTLRARTAP